MAKIDMVVLDMAGTTVQDNNEVENCFWEAAQRSGIETTREKIISMMGWSKRLVFETLWKEQLPRAEDALIQSQADHSFSLFKDVLEHHYITQDVMPTEGCLELFNFLHKNQIKIALTTGFYREVTDIILRRLGWDSGLDILYKGNGLVNASVTSDQVTLGRPSPYMIFRSMELCGVTDVRRVIKIGDTPSDLAEGKNAGCLSLGITNGTHTREQLSQYENNGLMDNLDRFRAFLSEFV
ncbi:MAG TPA: HAD family hydrolase [Bacteroidales bacterium]|nr:HAD family hydrolase [Bacteroidales bacterium]